MKAQDCKRLNKTVKQHIAHESIGIELAHAS